MTAGFAVLAAAQAPGAGGLTPGASLTTALTVEGLLFAAFSASYGLTEPTARGRHPFFAQGWFSACIVATIALVAVSAGAAWWATFEPDWPDGTNEKLRAAGLAVGIVLQPVFAAVLAWQAHKK